MFTLSNSPSDYWATLKVAPTKSIGRRDAAPTKLCFRRAHQLLERFLVSHRQIGENFAVHLDTRFLQPSHKLAVGHSERADGGIDARDPQLAEFAFTLLAIDRRIVLGMEQRFVRAAEEKMPRANLPLHQFQYFFVAAMRCNAAFHSSHVDSPKCHSEHIRCAQCKLREA